VIRIGFHHIINEKGRRKPAFFHARALILAH